MNRKDRLHRFLTDVVVHTPFLKMVLLQAVLWLLFCAGLYLAERGAPGATVTSYDQALYWGVAAFTTAGMAPVPVSPLARAIGGLWMVTGSVLFFGTIVATITTYFMRPMQRPHRRMIDVIEYNLEQLDQLSLEELDLLRGTVDTLIEHMEGAKARMLPEEEKTEDRQQQPSGAE